MANWSNPQLTSTYTNFVTEVKDRDVDLALQFDGTTSTNLPTGTIRWSSSANRWQKWSGSSWGELTNTYQLPNITISGVTNAGTLVASTADITAEITCGRVDVDSSSVAANGMYLPSTNTLGFATGSTPHYYIDSSGNLLYGRSTARTDVSGRLQLEGTGSTSANILLARNQNVGAATATLNFVKNHAASTTNTALAALSYLGQIGFWGANGTSYVRGVTIYAYADGAWSGSANPTGINIETAGGGRISLDSTGNFTLFNFGTNNVPVNLNGSAPNNALVLDASGNLGLGVVPSAWASLTALELSGGSLSAYSTTQSFLSQNAYYNAGWKYKNSAKAMQYLQDTNGHQWFTAPSGTAGNPITFTQAMTLTAGGYLGIGATSPGSPLTVESSAGNQFKITYPSIASYYLNVTSAGALDINKDGSSRLFIDSSGNVNIDSGTFYVDAVNNKVGIGTTTFRGTSLLDARGDISFGSNANYYGLLSYNAGSGHLESTSSDGGFKWIRASGFVTSMTLDASGRLLVGASTSPGAGELLRVEKESTGTEGAGIRFGGTYTIADNGTQTFTVGNGTLVFISNNTTGNGALFFCSLGSATISLLSDPDGAYATSVTAGRVSLTKSAGGNTITLTNKSGASRSFTIGKINNSD